MKSFARLFFVIGAVLSVYLIVFPEGLRFVSIPGSPAPLATSEHVTSNHKAEVAPAAIIEIVDLVVNGVPYQFKLASLDVEYVHSLAKEFCLSYQDGASLTPEKLEAGCTQVVVNNIFNKLKQKISGEPTAVPVSEVAEKTASTVYQVNVPVTNGRTYTVSFDAAIHNPYQVSDHFCRENAGELGLETENHVTQGCVPSVGKYIADQLESVGFVRATRTATPEVEQTNPQ